MAIRAYKNRGTHDIARGLDTKAGRRLLPEALHENAKVKLAALNIARSVFDLTALPGWRIEKLYGDRRGQCSIRMNDQYRICFRFKGEDVFELEIVDYH